MCLCVCVWMMHSLLQSKLVSNANFDHRFIDAIPSAIIALLFVLLCAVETLPACVVLLSIEIHKAII